MFAQTALDADPMLGGTHVTSIASTSTTLGVFAIWTEGLQPGTAYSFKAYATTSAGATGYTNAGTFTTLAAPGAPTMGSAVAGDSHARVFFTPPADSGGSEITGYTATSEDGLASGTCTSSPCHVFDLDNGTSYRFRVTATSAIGTGAPSAYSNTVVPTATGGTPPTISAIDDLSILENTSETIAFTVDDDDTPAATIAVLLTSSNQTLIDDATLAAGLSADDSVRTLLLQPTPNAHGDALITVTATDGDGDLATRSFMLHVLPANEPPLQAVTLDIVPAPRAPGAVLVAYDVLVGNTTATPTGNLTLTVAAPRLGGMTWSCTVDGSACTPAVGSGVAVTRFTLPAGGEAQVDIGGTAAATANFVEVSATLDIPSGGGVIERRRVVLVDPVGTDALFGSGFE